MGKTTKPSNPQRLFLADLARGGNGYRDMPSGRSASGGWSAIPIVCRKRGWINQRGEITDAGRAIVVEAQS